MKRTLILAALVAAMGLAPRAQLRVVPIDEEQGHVALGLALRHLGNAGVFMMATAHPDDENNGLLVQLNRGQGYRTALATATRGNGGQNEIGPEIFEALGILRTEELAALHRFDGAEQYFTRAVDFGFSFSIEETYEKWGRDEIIGDYVRLIRMIRPDVITGMTPTGTGGGQHHQASAVLSREAFKLAGDPAKYPEQITAGLRPWQPKKYYFTQGGPAGDQAAAAKILRLNLASYDPLLGKTYAEIGTEARSMHKCQGMAQLLALPGPSAATYQLVESTLPGQLQRDEMTLFDGIDSSIPGLAQFAGPRPPQPLVDRLREIDAAVKLAQRRFEGDGREPIVPALAAGLHAVRALRAELPALPVDALARYDVDVRLQLKEREFQAAILLANGVRVEVLADDGVVIPGQAVKVTVLVSNNGAADLNVKQIALSGFASAAQCTLTAPPAGGRGGGGRGAGRGGRGGGEAPPAVPLPVLKQGMVGRCDIDVKIPDTARVSEPYWHRAGEAGRYTFDDDAPFGLPYRPTAFRGRISLEVGGAAIDAAAGTVATAGGPAEEIVDDVPVEFRYEGNIFSGEKRTELLVVPEFSVRVSPDIAIVPVASLPALPTVVARANRAPQPSGRGRSAERAAASEREIRVTVMNDGQGPADSVVRLVLPRGWSAAPAEQAITFARQDESLTVRFAIKPAVDTLPGAYHARAVVTSGAKTFDRGYQTIEYPHIRRQHIYHDADVSVKVINVKTAPNLRIGYIVGVGDEVPAAIEQLGVKVEFLTPEDLAWGDLSRFTTIVTGVRAYERRADLRANNSRLLDYVNGGGTLIVQYNKFEFNEAQYGPYPAQVSGNRVTDEFAPVAVVAPGDPLVTFPNEITSATWNSWVQERGLYFLGDRDPRYRDLVALEDPFPFNKGEKRGALVETSYGKGRWVYVGLGLWRQLPAGTDGAYQLLANLISLAKAPAAAPPQPSRRPPAKR
ncbi:MAG: PIG-L family deacetylase [Acidobacteriota bacterium]